MNSTRLEDIKQEAARILINWGNGRVKSQLRGEPEYNDWFDKSKVTNYLYGIIDNVFLSGSTAYTGDTAIADGTLETVLEKLWHYSVEAVDLSIFTTNTDDNGSIEEDDGEGGACSGDTSTDNDHYRVGEQVCSIGVNVVTFYKDGVVSPFTTTDYIVIAWVEGYNGQRQSNLVPTTYTKGGFVVENVLVDGILKYQAILNS